MANWTYDTYKVMDVAYTEEEDVPVTHLFCRDENGEETHMEVVGHRPAFYVSEREYEDRKTEFETDTRVLDVERGHASIEGEDLVKVTCKLPKHVGELKKHVERTWEADVLYNKRFVIDADIKQFVRVPYYITSSNTQHGDVRVRYEDVSGMSKDRPEDAPSGFASQSNEDIQAVDSEDVSRNSESDENTRLSSSAEGKSSKDVEWDIMPRVLTVDIEVLQDGQFPEPEDADQPITAITAHDSYTDEYMTWILECEDWYENSTPENAISPLQPLGLEPSDGENRASIEGDVYVAETERELLKLFNDWVTDHQPDLLSGWNSDSFDWPYIVQRCQNLNQRNYLNWCRLGEGWTNSYGNVTLKGVSTFDMLKGFKKGQKHDLSDNSLDAVSKEVLDDSRYHKKNVGDLDDAWREDPEHFLDYNRRDVEAVVAIDREEGVVEMFDHFRSVAGTRYPECEHAFAMIDMLMLRRAQDEDIVLPTSEKPDESWYFGAYVFPYQAGKHRNVVYPDLASLYPYLMVMLNISPETAVGTEVDLKFSEYDEDDCVFARVDTRPVKHLDKGESYSDYTDGKYKAVVDHNDSLKWKDEPETEKYYFVKPDEERGFVSGVVKELVDMKYEYKGLDSYEAVKRTANAVYGVYGDSNSFGQGFRLFDNRLAESITLAGREVLKETASRFTEYLGESRDLKDAEVVAGDSVPSDEPVIVKDGRGEVSVKKVKNVIEGEKVWSDLGFTEIENVIRKKSTKDIYTVRTLGGVVHVTEDHSLLLQDGTEVSPTQLSEGDKLLQREPHLHEGSFDSKVSKEFAWLLGLFCADGSCGGYETVCGKRYSWAINGKDKEILNRAREILVDEGVETNLGEYLDSSNTNKLQLSGNGSKTKEIVRYFRQMCYDGQQKKVPDYILNSSNDVKFSFLQGYHSGDGYVNPNNKTEKEREFEEFWSKDKVLFQGIYTLLNNLGFTLTVSTRENYGNEYYRIRCVDFNRHDRNEVLDIYKVDYDGEFVYDLETKNNHFNAGIGSITVHNTDSIVTSIPSASTRDEAIEASKEACGYINSDIYGPFVEGAFNVDGEDNMMEVELESYAPVLFIPQKADSNDPDEGSKKRYAQWVTWDEGAEADEIKLKGFEAVRSDQAGITEDVQRTVLKAILQNDRGAAKEKVYKYIRETVEAVRDGSVPLKSLGKRQGIGQPLSEYGSENRRPQPTPKGAKYAHRFIDGVNITEGDKPMKFFVDRLGSDMPRTYVAETAEDGDPVEVIAVNRADEIPDDVEIDREKHIQKVVKKPLEPILAGMGWSWDEAVDRYEQQDLSSFST